MKRVVALILLLMSLAPLIAVRAAAENGGAPLYYARVDYMVTAEDSAEIMLRAGSIKTLSAPPEPPGYKLYYMEVLFEDGAPPNVMPVTYDSIVEERGRVKGVVSKSGDVSITCKSGNATLTVKVKAVYLRRVWVPIKGKSITINVESPGLPYSGKDISVKVTIENHAPYAIMGVKGPDGVNYLDPRKQELTDPNAIQLDPKHLVLDMSELPLGKYEILLDEGEENVLPSAFIAVHEAFYNDSVPAGGSRVYRVRAPKGWRNLGSIVILYCLEPARNSRSTAYIEAEAVDYAYFEDEIISIKGASFLIPPLNLRFWIKAYIAFGNSFRVINPMSAPINVIYVPVHIKEAGDWTPEGVFMRVGENDIGYFAMAYAVVQIPSYGRIVDVITPSGDSYGNYRSALKPWFSALRGVGVLEDEAYIQIKSEGAVEYGEYFFKIEWSPIVFKAVDSKGRPLIKATISVNGPLNETLTTGVDGTATTKLYKPGLYDVRVEFRGVTVAEKKLGTIISRKIEIPCAVYDLTVRTVDVKGSPLVGTEVSLITPDGSTLATLETNDNGMAVFKQVPRGSYVIHALYKRIEKYDEVEVDKDKTVEVKLDVLFEIPLVNIPVSTLEAAAAMLSIGVVTLMAKARGFRGREEEGEYDILEVGVGG